jgi:Ice-binding-like
MYAHNLSMHPVRRPAPARLAAVALVTLALLSAACSNDSTSRISGPPPLSLSRSGDGSSAAATGSNFAVLANAAVTCTNGTIVGDVGTFQAAPTGSVTRTICPITGTVHVGDGAATQAFNNFLSTYAALAPKPGDACTTLTGTLAGVTLSPGVYCFDAAATLTGVLTLSGPANGTWIFKVGTSGTGALTGTNFSVVMAGGARPCNVTWWIAQAATLTDSHFIGTILAGAGITLTRGTFAGNVWSKADVTITGTAVTGCAGGKGEDNGEDKDKEKCNQGVGNGSEGCDPGNSDHHNSSNDENGGTPGDPGRQGGHH